MHSDLEEEENPATFPEVVLITLLSSIPNLQDFLTILDLSFYKQSYSEINLSLNLEATTSIPAILSDSSIHSSPLPL